MVNTNNLAIFYKFKKFLLLQLNIAAWMYNSTLQQLMSTNIAAEYAWTRNILFLHVYIIKI